MREHVSDLPVPSGAYVVLDPLCPLVPAGFVAELVDLVRQTGRPHAGVRPVTDTVKVLHEGFVGKTLARDDLRQLASPVVLPEPRVIPPTLVELVAGLTEVVFVDAPPLARRVTDRSDLRVLEQLVS